jgi:hypothetical protein
MSGARIEDIVIHNDAQRKRATRGNGPWEVSHPKEEEVFTEVRTGRPLRVMGASRRHQRQLGRLGALCRLYG